MTAKHVQAALQKLATPKKAKASAWFFKTNKGQYGYGDKFRGVTVPEQRTVVKQFRQLPLAECLKLLQSPWHEDRLTAVLILVYQFEHGDDGVQSEITRLYLKNTNYVNNWDIVDSSAWQIVGGQSITLLKRLARSKSIWERRIAIIAAGAAIRQGNPKPVLTIAKLLLHDDHDLIHKAVGWMLREVGDRCSLSAETKFLDQYYRVMPRTMLRYAIEKFPKAQRLKYLNG